MLAEDARFLEYWFMGFINKDKKIINAVWDVVSLVTQLKMSIGGGGCARAPTFSLEEGLLYNYMIDKNNYIMKRRKQTVK